MRMVKTMIALLVAGLATAQAAAVTLQNAGFETPALGVGDYTYPFGAQNGWLYENSAGYLSALGGSAWYSTAYTGFEGNQFAFLQTGYGLPGRLSQTFTADASGAHMVTWRDAGRNLGSYDSTHTYTVYLDLLQVGSFTTSGSTVFVSHSAALGNLVAGNSYTLAFQSDVSAGADRTSFIDAVGVASTVPEPGAWAMLIAGFGIVGIAARRRNPVVAG